MKADILSLSGVPCRYQCWTGWPDHVTDDVRQHFGLTTLYLILEPIMKSLLWDNYSCKWPNTSVNRKNVFCGTSQWLCVQYYVKFFGCSCCSSILLMVQIVFVLAQLFLNWYKNIIIIIDPVHLFRKLWFVQCILFRCPLQMQNCLFQSTV